MLLDALRPEQPVEEDLDDEEAIEMDLDGGAQQSDSSDEEEEEEDEDEDGDGSPLADEDSCADCSERAAEREEANRPPAPQFS